MMNKFFRLTADISNKLFNLNLTGNDYRLWHYLSTLDPFGDRPLTLPTSTEICKTLKMSRASYFRSKAKLQKEKLFNFIDVEVKFINLLGSKTNRGDRLDDKTDNLDNDTPRLKNDTPSLKSDTPSLKSEIDSLKNDTPSLKSDTPTALKANDSNGFSHSQTSSDSFRSSQTLPDSVQEGQGEDKSVSKEEERQERGVNNFEEEEIKKAIEDSLPLDKEFDNQQLVEQNQQLAQQNYLAEQQNHHFPVCRTPVDNTDNPTSKPIIGVSTGVSEKESKYADNKECPKSYEDCPTEFLEWKAKNWANHFGYSLQKGLINLRRHLTNKPEKIKGYWQEWKAEKAIATEQQERLVEVDGKWITVSEYDRMIESRKPKDEEIPVNETVKNMIGNFLNAIRGGNPSYGV